MNNDQDAGNAGSTTNGAQQDTVKKAVGFAAMDPLRRREIASMGGKAAHEKGTAHQFNSETGRTAALHKASLTG